ncbi:hypothetical protein [Shimia sagamensis]|uniref:I-spanin n=1 Tax=Shimia sagamensis TaxID=1566352 RepID=A0ABY1NH35_9RHOB|nr:hypothetical protein [Shimia sagamensis]SMP09670.1 hypothetical protein SAMN06265373_1021 [Shimia sagamensis]
MPSARFLLAVVALVLIASGGAGWVGYTKGIAKAEAAHNQELLDQIAKGQEADQKRRAAEQERARMAEELEAAAYAEPVVVERCLGPNRVQRLNALR